MFNSVSVVQYNNNYTIIALSRRKSHCKGQQGNKKKKRLWCFYNLIVNFDDIIVLKEYRVSHISEMRCILKLKSNCKTVSYMQFKKTKNENVNTER